MAKSKALSSVAQQLRREGLYSERSRCRGPFEHPKHPELPIPAAPPKYPGRLECVTGDSPKPKALHCSGQCQVPAKSLSDRQHFSFPLLPRLLPSLLLANHAREPEVLAKHPKGTLRATSEPGPCPISWPARTTQNAPCPSTCPGVGWRTGSPGQIRTLKY